MVVTASFGVGTSGRGQMVVGVNLRVVWMWMWVCGWEGECQEEGERLVSTYFIRRESSK